MPAATTTESDGDLVTDGPQYPQYPGDSGSGDGGTPGQQPVPPQQPPGQQTPPPGYHPPPPPGYAPPPAYDQSQQAYGGPISHHPMQSGAPTPGAYASWGSRLGAYLLDGLMTLVVLLVPLGIGGILAFGGAEVDPITDELTNVNGLGILVMVLGGLVALVFDVWNRAVRQGRTTQTLGKKVVGIKVVSVQHGGPIGVGAGFGRWAMQTLVPNVVPLLGSIYALYDGLSPLWDDRNQSVHDKVVTSVVVRA